MAVEKKQDDPEARMWRWFAVCAAAVVMTFIIACTIGYLVHPKQWMCTVVMSSNKCDSDGNLIN